jgi:hypothetical protein
MDRFLSNVLYRSILDYKDYLSLGKTYTSGKSRDILYRMCLVCAISVPYKWLYLPNLFYYYLAINPYYLQGLRN